MTHRAILAALALAIPAAAAAAQPGPDAQLNPRAIELFERDWALMHWAVKNFDRDRNGVISIAEANAGALAFKRIADGNGDGRVTPYEYQRGRDFVIARY